MSGRALLYVQRARTQLAVDQQLNPLEQTPSSSALREAFRYAISTSLSVLLSPSHNRDSSASSSPTARRAAIPRGSSVMRIPVLSFTVLRGSHTTNRAERAVPDIDTAGASPGLQASAVSAPCLFESRNWRTTESLRGTTG